MSIVSVQPKSFILALFIRDNNERFLLGDNGYDFKDSQLHFAANTIENDEVQKQGADGVMIAGQVRRASVQSFDGYVGDATMAKETIEQMRRDFIAFFLKGHHYRVIYIDCNRNAWQRKGGYLVDAPEVKELWQIHPEYHVGLNFEDVNYYSYDEDADGNEILANLVNVPVSTEAEGGLVWDEDGAVSEDAGDIYYDTAESSASGKSIAISDAAEAPLASFQLDGETSQNGTPTPSAPVAVQTVTGAQTITINNTSYEVNLGKNLANYIPNTTLPNGVSLSVDSNGVYTLNGTCTANGTFSVGLNNVLPIGPSKTMSFNILSGSITGSNSIRYRIRNRNGVYSGVPDIAEIIVSSNSTGTLTKTVTNELATLDIFVAVGVVYSNYKFTLQLELGTGHTDFAPYFTPIELCKIGDYQDYIYKSGGKWYKHKAIGKVIYNGTEDWQIYNDFMFLYEPSFILSYGDNGYMPTNYLADNFTRNSLNGAFSDRDASYLIQNVWGERDKQRGVAMLTNSTFTDLSAWKTWLGSHNTTIYYQLDNPTEEEITNTALITQLNALLTTARTYAGTNNITTITPNEQGTLEISYYTKYQPMVGSGGYVWEAGGAGGPTVIMNNSIDSVSPVWTIYGPTTNPQLENATTGEIIEYVGTIAQGQTLTIDMGEQTASLDGLNVISNLVGDFVQLAPGRNNIIYSVSGEAGASELGWSEIVG